MKASEIINEAKTGAMIFKIAVRNAAKIIHNASGELSFSNTLFQRKYFARNGDEIVKSGNKETNITELINVISIHSDHEMIIRVGKIDYSGIIEIDL